jgi:hypothetical protein
MPDDEYASVGGGGTLKLKGSKVKKHKKKKEKGTDLEKALETGGEKTSASDRAENRDKKQLEEENDEEEEPVIYKTEAEQRFAEVKRKKVSSCNYPTIHSLVILQTNPPDSFSRFLNRHLRGRNFSRPTKKGWSS